MLISIPLVKRSIDFDTLSQEAYVALANKLSYRSNNTWLIPRRRKNRCVVRKENV